MVDEKSCINIFLPPVGRKEPLNSVLWNYQHYESVNIILFTCIFHDHEQLNKTTSRDIGTLWQQSRRSSGISQPFDWLITEHCLVSSNMTRKHLSCYCCGMTLGLTQVQPTEIISVPSWKTYWLLLIFPPLLRRLCLRTLV